MERCKEKQGFSNTEFPDVKARDTVENENGDVYLVAYNPNPLRANHILYLVELTSGKDWSPTSLWGGSKPSDWKKVECCFMVKE